MAYEKQVYYEFGQSTLKRVGAKQSVPKLGWSTRQDVLFYHGKAVGPILKERLDLPRDVLQVVVEGGLRFLFHDDTVEEAIEHEWSD